MPLGTVFKGSPYAWNQRTVTPLNRGVNSMQALYQQYMQQMMQAQKWQQSQAAQAQTSAQDYIAKLAPKLEGYLTRMQSQYDAGLKTLQNSNADSSYLKQAWQSAMAGYANPGWGKKTIGQMKSGIASRGAANQAVATRQLERSMSGKGMAGPAAEYLKASLKNRYGMQTSGQLRDTDIQAATYAADSKKQYLGMAGGYAGQLANLGAQQANAIANYQQSYNPLNWMQQTQSILSPLQTIGYGAGYGSAW